MADNTSQAGTDTLRTEDRGSVKTGVSLIDVGGSSAEALIGDSGVAMPVRGLAAHDAAVSGNPNLIAMEAKDFDGSALPNAVSAEGDVVRAAGSQSGVQYVMAVNEDGSAVGSVTANAGTNLNTSALALESGGNLAGAATSLAIVDDWDESDRAKVNMIVGQAGVAAGAGAVGATTQRVTLASDDPSIAWLNSINGHAENCETYTEAIASAVYIDDADWSDGTSKHLLVGGLYQSTPQSITDGDVGPLQVDASGNLKVAIVSGAGSGGTASADDADFTAGTTSGTPAMGVYESSPTSVTNGDMGVVGITQTRALRVSVENTLTVASHAVTNAGTFAVQVDGAALTSLQLLDDAVATTGSAITAKGFTACGTDGTNARAFKTDSSGELQVDVLTLPALSAGTAAIGKLAANSGVDIGDVDVTSISAGTNLIGDVGLQGRTTGGLSIFRSIDLDESEEEIKGSAGTLYWVHAANLASSVRYLKLYDGTAAGVTVGSTTPVLTLPIPAATNKAGFTFAIPQGLAFSTGITAAATTGVADADTGAPGANEIVLNCGYK